MLEMDLFSRLAVAQAIGLMVGIERGWRSRDDEKGDRAAGLRTFGLSGLIGGICGVLTEPLGPAIVGMGFWPSVPPLALLVGLRQRLKAPSVLLP